jgi:hypothetical protein
LELIELGQKSRHHRRHAILPEAGQDVEQRGGIRRASQRWNSFIEDATTLEPSEDELIAAKQETRRKQNDLTLDDYLANIDAGDTIGLSQEVSRSPS